MFADLVEARKYHGWQTACVIQELEREISIQNTVDFRRLHFLRATARSLINALQQSMESNRCWYTPVETTPHTAVSSQPIAVQEDAEHASTNHSTFTLVDNHHVDSASSTAGKATPSLILPAATALQDMSEDRRVIYEVEAVLQQINRAMSTSFNHQFGSAFRTDGAPTMFAFSVRRYVRHDTTRRHSITGAT